LILDIAFMWNFLRQRRDYSSTIQSLRGNEKLRWFPILENATQRQLEHFCNALRNNTVEKEIYILGLHQGVTLTSLADCLANHNRCIETVYIVINKNPNKVHQSSININPILQAFDSRSTSVKALFLHGSRFDDGDAKTLARALTTNSSLQGVHITTNTVGDEGAVALADMIRTNATLETLAIVSPTRITDRGVSALCQAMENNFTITDFQLDCASAVVRKIHQLAWSNRHGHELMEKDRIEPGLWPYLLAGRRRNASRIYQTLQKRGADILDWKTDFVEVPECAPVCSQAIQST
jgi:hypothetical protein